MMNTVYFHSAGVDLYSLLNTEYTGHVFVFHNRHIFFEIHVTKQSFRARNNKISLTYAV